MDVKPTRRSNGTRGKDARHTRSFLASYDPPHLCVGEGNILRTRRQKSAGNADRRSCPNSAD